MLIFIATINMVVIGHVDAGKSTLIGHLLHSLGVVNQKAMHKYESESRKIGKASFLYAWVLDEHEVLKPTIITYDLISIGRTFSWNYNGYCDYQF